MKIPIILPVLFMSIVSLSSAGVKAPDFILSGEGDAVYKLSDFKGNNLVLFFFSLDCKECQKAIRLLKELNKKSDGRYEILGVLNGTTKEELENKDTSSGTEFAIALGTEKVKRDYKVSGTPYFWVIGSDGTLKERCAGEKAEIFLMNFLNAGNLTERVGLFELSSDYKGYESKTIETLGILSQTSPSYFKKPVFIITNGIDKVRVSSWLPLEAAPAPRGINRQRKKAMSDMIGKYVNVTGRVVLEDGKPFIEVKDAKALE